MLHAQAPGLDSPQELSVAEIRRLIAEAGRDPVERDTLYHEIERDQPLGREWRLGRELAVVG